MSDFVVGDFTAYTDIL